MGKLKNDLLLKAARGEKTQRTPVWVMRQAGRILPEYRAVRNRLSGFKELVETPELAAEVTLQPVDILGVDAAIIFSDILVVPEAMGLTYEMVEAKGPVFPKTIKSAADVKSLRVADAGHIRYTIDAIWLVKKQLNDAVPVIGFAGAPWTIFSYMIEGQGSKTFSNARKMLYTQPQLAHQLLDMITDTTIHYLQGQIEAGADLVQIFDSWAGILPADQYREFGLRYISRICEAIDTVPVTVFAKGAETALKDLKNLKCNTIGLDWNSDITAARDLFKTEKTLQGNLDPCALYASDEKIVALTENMLKTFGPFRHIANLGHGVYPDTRAEAVKLFIDTVKQFKHNEL